MIKHKHLAIYAVLFLLLGFSGRTTASSRIPQPLIPVLAYHSVMPHEFYYPANVSNPWVLSEEVFYAQMRYLYEHNFTTITAVQLINFLYHEGDLPYNPILITFDDGYLDNYLFAAPIMRQFGFTGIVFLITSDIPYATPDMTAKPIKYMSMAEITAAADVFEYGSHTHVLHEKIDGRPQLTFESIENIRADIERSFAAPIAFVPAFAYPFGRHSPNAVQALERAEVEIAFTTNWGYVRHNANPFLLPRFSITSEWTLDMFSNTVHGRWRR